MSKTPRTDAATCQCIGDGYEDSECCSATVARQLEVELTAVRAELAEHKEQGAHLYCETCGSCGIEDCCPPGKCWKAKAESAEAKLAQEQVWVNLLAEWEDENGTIAAILPSEYEPLMQKIRDLAVRYSPREARAIEE